MFFRKLTKLKEEDFFSFINPVDNINLNGKTNLKVLYYGDEKHPHPLKFIDEISSEYFCFISDVKMKNYVFPVSVVGYNSLRSIFEYCENKNLLQYTVFEHGDKLEFNYIDNWQPDFYIIPPKTTYIRIDVLNKFEVDEYKKKKRTEKRNVHMQVAILIATIATLLVTIVGL